MKKLILTILSCCLTSALYPQSINELRRLVMHSDVIVAGATAMRSDHYNDYLSRYTYTLESIDKMVYNPAGFQPGDTVLVLQQYNHFSDIWIEDVVYIEPMVEMRVPDERYTDLHFIRLERGEYPYVTVGTIKNIKWEKFTGELLPAITDLLAIKKVGDMAERYSKTIDWYLRWNGYPEREFFEFYKSRGIIGDDPALTGTQLVQAKKLFLEGSERLWPFIKDKFPVETHTYYLDKMKKIRNMDDPGSERWEFYYAVDNVFSFKYDTMEYLLMSQMVDRLTDNYDRKRIMGYFIEKTGKLLKELKEQEK